MEDRKWQDPVFGYVPKEFRSWYEQESGTYWDERRNAWRISSEVVSVKETKKGNYNVYKSNIFQDRISTAKETILNRIPNIPIIISPSNIFGLMKDGVTNIKYQHEGNEYIEEIRL